MGVLVSAGRRTVTLVSHVLRDNDPALQSEQTQGRA
jgi:hypothetical protein